MSHRWSACIGVCGQCPRARALRPLHDRWNRAVKTLRRPHCCSAHSRGCAGGKSAVTRENWQLRFGRLAARWIDSIANVVPTGRRSETLHRTGQSSPKGNIGSWQQWFELGSSWRGKCWRKRWNAVCAVKILLRLSGPDIPTRKQSAISGTAQIAVTFLNRLTRKHRCHLCWQSNSYQIW